MSKPAPQIDEQGRHAASDFMVEVKPNLAVPASRSELDDIPVTDSHAAVRMYWATSTDAQAINAASRLARGSGSIRPLDPAAVRAIGFAFEGDLPIALDELHAVGVLSGTSVVICAVERRHLAGLPSHHLTLSPTALPGFVSAAVGPALQPAHFNLLQGEFEPPALRAARSRVWNVLTLAACIGMLLTAAGLWRRAHTWMAESGERAVAAQASADQMYPGEQITPRDAVRRAALEIADVESLRALAVVPNHVSADTDCSTTLASLLARWPQSPTTGAESFQTEVLSLTDTSIAATVLTNADARTFLGKLSAPDGWTMQQPRLSQSPSGVRLAVQMTRAVLPKPTSPKSTSPNSTSPNSTSPEGGPR